MTFNHETYKARILAWNGREYDYQAKWGDYLGVSAKTVQRHCKGLSPIKKSYWMALHELDKLGYPTE
tara:strand:+ start:261 stop:461 length:201 start_codon:yes stop_codon:yes gene_type:complete